MKNLFKFHLVLGEISSKDLPRLRREARPTASSIVKIGTPTKKRKNK